LNHTSGEHAEKLAEGRRNSSKWREAVAAANTRTKKGKPARFRDPIARGKAIAHGLSRPETKALRVKVLKEVWAKRSEEERQAIGAKSSASQKGKEFTPEHLANLQAANAKPRSETHRQKLSEARKGQSSWNKGLTKFTNASVAAMSAKQVGRIPDYNKYRAHYDGPKGKYLMRSRWEVAYAEWLDEQGIDWRYEPRWFNLGGTSYTPDFYLPAEDRYVEIKGRMTEENAKKLKRFAERYPHVNLTVLQRAELTAIGLLDKHCRLVKRQ
jgi:hypothetical protein